MGSRRWATGRKVGVLARSACTEGGTLQPWCLIIAWNLLRATGDLCWGSPPSAPPPPPAPSRKTEQAVKPPPRRCRPGGGRGAADSDRLLRPCPVSCPGAAGAGRAALERGRGEEAVGAIAVVGNPHWISVGLGVFKREYIYIYIYKSSIHILLSGFVPFLFDTVNVRPGCRRRVQVGARPTAPSRCPLRALRPPGAGGRPARPLCWVPRMPGPWDTGGSPAADRATEGSLECPSCFSFQMIDAHCHI